MTIEKGKDIPFVLAERPLEIENVAMDSSSNKLGNINFKDKDGAILANMFYVFNNGPSSPTVYRIEQCMSSAGPTKPYGGPTLPKNRIIISKVKGGLTVEFNEEIIIEMTSIPAVALDATKCNAFLEGDVQIIEFLSIDTASQSFRQHGEINLF